MCYCLDSEILDDSIFDDDEDLFGNDEDALFKEEGSANSLQNEK